MATLTKRAAASMAAMLALATPQMAMAQDCVAQADVVDGVIYAVPVVTETVQAKCGSVLGSNSFLATGAADMRKKYADLQDQVWPGTTRLIEAFASRGRDSSGIGLMISNLPAENVKPLVDAIVQQKLAGELKVTDCQKYDRGLSLLAPLEPRHSAEIAVFIFELANVKNPKICPKDA